MMKSDLSDIKDIDQLLRYKYSLKREIQQQEQVLNQNLSGVRQALGFIRNAVQGWQMFANLISTEGSLLNVGIRLLKQWWQRLKGHKKEA